MCMSKKLYCTNQKNRRIKFITTLVLFVKTMYNGLTNGGCTNDIVGGLKNKINRLIFLGERYGLFKN